MVTKANGLTAPLKAKPIDGITETDTVMLDFDGIQNGEVLGV